MVSLSTTTFSQISGSPLNLSKSKMLWSFSKAERFPAKSHLYNEKFCYDLPPVLQTAKGAGIGYGKRRVFGGDGDRAPGPCAYPLKTAIDLSVEKKKGPSFGIARSFYDKVYCKAQPPLDKSKPGPGQYDILQDFGTTGASRYTMRKKTISQMDEIQKNKNPGPGQYPHPPAIDPKGRQASWSKYSSSGACMFNPPTSARFAEIGKSKLPGPGTYTHINTTTENGSYFVSKFKCSGARTFGKTIRYPVGKSRVVLHTPGPGSYRLPSDFGHYETKSKRVFTAQPGHRMPKSTSEAQMARTQPTGFQV